MCSAPALTLAVGDIRNNCRSRSRRHGRSRLIRRAFRFPSPTTPVATPDRRSGVRIRPRTGQLVRMFSGCLLIVLLIAVALVPRLASATTEPIGCDAALTRSTTDPLQADHFTFNVAEGELVEITVLNGTPAGSNFNAQWRLLTATGAPAASCGGFNDAVHGFDLQRDCGPLPASGNPYQIEVQDQGLNDTGTYRAAINGVSQCVPITTTTTTSTTSTTSTTLTTTTTTTTTTTISTTTTTAPPTTTSTTSSTSTSTTTSTTTTTAPPTTTSTTSTT